MNLPHKPEFDIDFNGTIVTTDAYGRAYGEQKQVRAISEETFNAWYDEVFKGALTVYGWMDGDGACRFSEMKVIGSDKGEATHSATLIGITPVMEESAEDLLRELVDEIWGNTSVGGKVPESIHKARRYLESKK